MYFVLLLLQLQCTNLTNLLSIEIEKETTGKELNKTKDKQTPRHSRPEGPAPSIQSKNLENVFLNIFIHFSWNHKY